MYPYTMPSPSHDDLRNWLTKRHGSSWTTRTGVGQGTDISLALGDWCDHLNDNGGYGELMIPPGTWRMANAISPERLKGKRLLGTATRNATKIVVDMSAGIAFHWSGFGGFTGGGMDNITLQLEKDKGDANITAIRLSGDSTYQPDDMVFRNVKITAITGTDGGDGESYWLRCVHIDGSARSSPKGVRVGTWEDIQMFRSWDYPMFISGAVQFGMHNIGTYSGKGATGNNIYVQGGTEQIYINGLTCGGQLNISAADQIELSGSAATVAFGANVNRVFGGMYASSGFSGSIASQDHLTKAAPA